MYYYSYIYILINSVQSSKLPISKSPKHRRPGCFHAEREAGGGARVDFGCRVAMDEGWTWRVVLPRIWTCLRHIAHITHHTIYYIYYVYIYIYITYIICVHIYIYYIYIYITYIICIYICIYASPPKTTYLCLLVMLHYNSFGTIIVPSEYCID